VRVGASSSGSAKLSASLRKLSIDNSQKHYLSSADDGHVLYVIDSQGRILFVGFFKLL